MVAAPPVAMAASPVSTGSKKKRGRPRKYAPDGSVLALSPMPISASIPLTGDFSAWKQPGRGRPVDSFKKKHKLEFDSPGNELTISNFNCFLGQFYWVRQFHFDFLLDL